MFKVTRKGQIERFYPIDIDCFPMEAKRPISSRLPFFDPGVRGRAAHLGSPRCFCRASGRRFDPLTLEMLVGESLSRRHSGTIPGEARVAACLLRSCARRSRPVAFRPDLSSTPADQSLATSRDKCRVPAGLGLRACAVAFPVYPRIPVVRMCPEYGTTRRYGYSSSSASALCILYIYFRNMT